MKITTCSNRPIPGNCPLEDFQYQVDPYVGCAHCCRYCYVLPQAETDWSSEIMIHENLADRLRAALEDIPPQTFYMGWHTDPYQPCEKDQQQTRTVLELLHEKGFSASILTKSDLVLRDVDLLADMPGSSVSMSIAFQREEDRRNFEDNTMPTEARIQALKLLKEKGVRTSGLLCPVIPNITDTRSLIRVLAPHASIIRIYGLSMLSKEDICWKNVEAVLSRHYPDKKDEIEEIVFNRRHTCWTSLRQDLEHMAEAEQLNLSIHL